MAKLPNDDLFEGTKMSFGQHLEELRVALFKAMIGVVAGFLLGLLVAHYVVEFIQTPLKRSLSKYYVTKALLRRCMGSASVRGSCNHGNQHSDRFGVGAR